MPIFRPFGRDPELPLVDSNLLTRLADGRPVDVETLIADLERPASTVQTSIRRLRRRGDVRADVAPPDGPGRPRVLYAITQKGLHALEQEARTYEARASLMKAALAEGST